MEAKNTDLKKIKTPATAFEEFCKQEELFQKNNDELAELNALEKNGIVKNRWSLRLKSFFMFSWFALLFNIGLACMFGEICGKTFYGFFILACIYLVIGTVLYVLYISNRSRIGHIKI